jgi:hypothetical protein
MAVCQIVQKQNIEMFIFDFTRTLGEDTSLKDMFQVIEELMLRSQAMQLAIPQKSLLILPHNLVKLLIELQN